MASVMVHRKQVMVQGGAMIQGQATFIPSQNPLIPGLQGGQTAIIQGGSFIVQGQSGQSIVSGQPQGQAVMIQGQPTKHATFNTTASKLLMVANTIIKKTCKIRLIHMKMYLELFSDI